MQKNEQPVENLKNTKYRNVS